MGYALLKAKSSKILKQDGGMGGDESAEDVCSLYVFTDSCCYVLLLRLKTNQILCFIDSSSKIFRNSTALLQVGVKLLATMKDPRLVAYTDSVAQLWNRLPLSWREKLRRDSLVYWTRSRMRRKVH